MPNAPRINLDDFSDQELGALVRKSMKEAGLHDLIHRIAEAAHEAEHLERAHVEAHKAQRAEQAEVGVLPSFTFKSVVVPALDVSEVNLAEIPDRAARSPYNKIRCRLGESTLPTKDEPGSGVQRCTWQMLVEEHQRLMALSPATGTSMPALTPDPDVISAPIDEAEQARVDALVRVLGISESNARTILTSR